MPFGVGHFPLIALLLVVALIIFGPGKLPELGSSLGKAIREFKSHTSDVHNAVVVPPAEPIVPVAPPTVQAVEPRSTETPDPIARDRALSA
jgi:sec-independent protein translocase protein TatA